MMRRPSPRAVIALAATVAVATACSGQDPTGEAAAAVDAPGPQAVDVVASFYPVEFLAERVGGDRVSVTGLTPVGTEPHDLALDGPARAALDDAAVVLYLGADFQPDVEAAVASLPSASATTDLLTAPGLELIPAPADLGKESLAGNSDPHVWLSPDAMIAMARAVEASLAAVDPQNATEYRARLSSLVDELSALDADLREQLSTCSQTTIVTSHAAFGYLAHEYGLEQVAIAGISPDDEPDPATLAQITETARAAGVTTVFFEESLPADLAETVAAEIGASTSLLAALEFEPEDGEDYLSVMRGNLDRLVAGLDCR